MVAEDSARHRGEVRHDIRAVNEYYRAAAVRVPHRSYRDDAPSNRVKRKILARG